jgi:deazaflavin-dependent oxidoreductase (nitroreductase family)
MQTIDTHPRIAVRSRPSPFATAMLWLARRTNGLTRPLSGSRFFPLFGTVYHRGRRSGQLYAAPVAVRATPDGFVISLPYEGAHWFRNVLAAGECIIRWKGVDYRVVDPRIVDWATAGAAFHPIQRALLQLAHTDRFLLLRRASS